MPTPSERGILANVYILYRRGVRLSAEERQALKPLLARMVIASEFRPYAAGGGYMVHMAELSDPTNKTMYCPKVGAPLFDPVIIKATAAGIYLRGRQIDASTGDRTEFCQMWKVIPVFDAEK